MSVERVLTSFFGLGFIRPGPGTWGSLGGLVFWWLLIFVLEWHLVWLTGLFLVMVFLSREAVLRVEKELQSEDAGEIVIDEVLGIFFPIILSDGSWLQLLLGFILFRAFDIFKPAGIKFFDRNHLRAWGVIVDDLLAGVYAGALIFAIDYSLILSELSHL